MAERILSADRLKQLFHYDSDAGIFTRIVPTLRSKAGETAGTKNKLGYLVLRVDGRLYACHRLAWLYANGQWPEGVIDHVNGSRSDNRIDNLRDVSRRTNQQNMRSAFSSSKTGLLGASYCKEVGRYVSRIRAPGGKYLVIGYFDSPELAHESYVEAKRRLQDGCTI